MASYMVISGGIYIYDIDMKKGTAPGLFLLWYGCNVSYPKKPTAPRTIEIRIVSMMAFVDVIFLRPSSQ